MLLVLWYGALQVVDGGLSSGLLTSFMLYTLTIAMGLSIHSHDRHQHAQPSLSCRPCTASS